MLFSSNIADVVVELDVVKLYIAEYKINFVQSVLMYYFQKIAFLLKGMYHSKLPYLSNSILVVRLGPIINHPDISLCEFLSPRRKEFSSNLHNIAGRQLSVKQQSRTSM